MIEPWLQRLADGPKVPFSQLEDKTLSAIRDGHFELVDTTLASDRATSGASFVRLYAARLFRERAAA